MKKAYQNQYIEMEDHVILYIYGLKHEAKILIEKSDYEAVSKMHWGLMSVGRKGYQKIVPYTTINRTSVPLGRWLLNVTEKGKRVEHIDRNNHNFLRSNLYIVNKQDYKRQVSKNAKDMICGIYEIKQKNGKVTGYKIQYTNPQTQKKEWKTFNANTFKSLEKAKKEAIRFKMNLIYRNMEKSA